MGVSEVFQRCFDKTEAYRKLARKYSFRDRQAAYIGDDIVDIPLLKKVGLPVVVADADEAVKPFARMITKKGGGRGAVREVSDLILKAKGLWQAVIDGYSET